MKDKFKGLEVEMTLDDKFKLACAAIGANVNDVTSNDISRRYTTQRAFVANFLSEYINHGLPDIMQKSPKTVYAMINKISMRRIRKEPDVLRLDNLLSKHIDKWMKFK